MGPLAPLAVLAALNCAASASAGPAAADLFEVGMPTAGFFSRATPSEAGLDGSALRALADSPLGRASDSLIVLKDGRTVLERYYGRPPRTIPLASVTKAVVSLAVIGLIADGRLTSEDAPVSAWLGGWSRGAKSQVRLRHLMNHTSGLACRPQAAGGDRILSRQRDMAAFAASLPVEAEPGTRYCYNNAGVQLLARVVRIAAGRAADDYLEDRIFRILGIAAQWSRDASGEPSLYGGLSLSGRDAAKIGQLFLQGGRWGGTALLPQEIMRRFTGPSAESPENGLLWFVARDQDGRPIGFYHTGSFGEALAVYPAWGLVIVRLRHPQRSGSGSFVPKRFFELVEAVGRSSPR